jgi:ABC-type transport system involved in cytochrome c biogenesis permease subunit
MANESTFDELSDNSNAVIRQLPTIIAIVGAVLIMIWRFQTVNFMSDEALMMVALACYLLAALFELTNLYAPSAMSTKISLWTATLGVFFNLSSWLVRWVAAYEREIGMLRDAGNPETPWFFRYIPFANLYDLSLAFAFGAGLTTLLLANRKQFRFIGAFTLPLAAMILTLARFIGSEFVDLPPVLDSYWRPIHVGVASLSYGVTLVCFAIAVIYLLKDKVKPEAMAIWASIYGLAVIGTISKFSVLTEFVYRAGIFVPSTGPKPIFTPFRLAIPYVGGLLSFSALLLAGAIIAYLLYLYKDNLAARRVGKFALIGAFVLQIAAIGFWVNGVKSATNIYPRLQDQIAADRSQLLAAGREILSKQGMPAKQFAQITPAQFEQAADHVFVTKDKPR